MGRFIFTSGWIGLVLGFGMLNVGWAEVCSADKVLKRFVQQIAPIRRASNQEDGIRTVIIGVAEKNYLAYHVDAVGNVLVRVPASSGYESAPGVALQGHMDMVESVSLFVGRHDWNDGVRVATEPEWMYALGTSLGADNGLGGLATLLEIMDQHRHFVHGPLELIFTVSEETGLHGAKQFDLNPLRSRLMINLDHIDAHEICIGCPGSRSLDGGQVIRWMEVPDHWDVLLRLAIVIPESSSKDIHLLRQSHRRAAAMLMRTIDKLQQSGVEFGLTSLIAGYQLIYPELGMTVFRLPHTEVHRIVRRMRKNVRGHFQVKVDVLEDTRHRVLHPESLEKFLRQWRIIAATRSIPNPVVPDAWSFQLLLHHVVLMGKTARWSVDITFLDDDQEGRETGAFIDRIRRVGYDLMRIEPWDLLIWKPQTSLLSELAQEVFERNGSSTQPSQKTRLSVLSQGYRNELTVFAPKRSDIQMISMGPTLLNVNTHQERVHIPSVHVFWRNLMGILEGVAQWR